MQNRRNEASFLHRDRIGHTGEGVPKHNMARSKFLRFLGNHESRTSTADDLTRTLSSVRAIRSLCSKMDKEGFINVFTQFGCVHNEMIGVLFLWQRAQSAASARNTTFCCRRMILSDV